MELNYIKASPCSNTTVFILDYAEKHNRGKIASVVMDYDHLCAEQLGYIVPSNSKEAVLRLEMSGGEFCGNALLSAAAYVRHKKLTKEENFFLESSGVDGLLSCKSVATAHGKYLSEAQMPDDYSVSNLSIDSSIGELTGSLISWNGISHFVFEGTLPNNAYDEIMSSIIKKCQNSAYGIIPYVAKGAAEYVIAPFVYVPETGSRVFERACGSGSLSLAVALANGKSRKITVRQPGGEIRVSVGEKNYISAEVFFSCEGKVFVEFE